MAGSLLAFLYPHIKGSQEDVATLSLCHIISQSEELRKAFTEEITSKLNYTIYDDLFYNTQVVGEQKERPDIVGYSSLGKEKIICEAKFFAALTNNQPKGYLKRLASNESCGLIFICPQSRIVGLWEQLKAKETSICTPFWLNLNDNKWSQEGKMGEFLKCIPAREKERDQDGNIYIALKPPIARTLEETAQELCDQILCYIDRYKQYSIDEPNQ